MTESVLEALLEIFEEASEAGDFDGASFVLFHAREPAYQKSLRDGVLYDATVNGLVISQAGKAVGITPKGREAYLELQNLQKLDGGGVIANKLVSVFLPASTH